MNRTIRLVLVMLFAWLLGGCGGGGGSGTRAPVATSIVKIAGDTLTASPGAAVATAPQVRVLDADGHPMAGIEVDFAVLAGGGSVQVQSARTDASGDASCGTWTLGATKGTQSVTATVAGLLPTAFTAKALQQSPGLTVSPASAGSSDATYAAMLRVDAVFEIASVTATIGSVALPLQPSASDPAVYVGSMDLTGLPSGAAEVVYTATDVAGHVTDALLDIQIDRSPAISVTSPVDGAVARPTLQLDVSCTDDQACTQVRATIGGQLVATGTQSLHQAVDLSSLDGSAQTIVLSVSDAAGHVTSIMRSIYVESSTFQHVVAQGGGPLLDYLGTRTLYLDSAQSTPALVLHDGSGDVLTTLEPANAHNQGITGGLFPAGAIYAFSLQYSNQADGADVVVKEWRDGTSTVLTAPLSRDLIVAGNWAAYSSSNGTVMAAWRRDLTTGASTQVSPNDAWASTVEDLAANGDVVFRDNEPTHVVRVGRYAQGAFAWLWDGECSAGARTDGAAVIATVEDCGSSQETIGMTDGTTYRTLRTAQPGVPWSYAVANGWVAYLVRDAQSVAQVWRHGPAGEQQVTQLAHDATVDAVGKDGTIVLDAGGRRYLAAPGKALEDIGSALGKVIVRDDAFVVLLGRDAAQVQP